MAENEQLSQLKAQVAQYDLYLGSSSNLPQNIRDADRETQRQFIDRIQASRASVLGSISQLEKGQISGTTDQLIGQANEAGRSASYYGSLGRSQSNAESNFSTLLDKYNSGKATTQDIKNLSQSGFLNQEQRSQLQASIQPQQQNIFTSNQNMSYDPYLRDTFGNPIGTRTPPSERAGTTSINFNAVNNRNQSQYISELNMTPYRNGTLTTGLSMTPYIPVGTKLAMTPYTNQSLNVGDIIRFKYEPYKNESPYTFHRIIGIDNNNIFTRGDNNPSNKVEKINRSDITDIVFGKYNNGTLQSIGKPVTTDYFIPASQFDTKTIPFTGDLSSVNQPSFPKNKGQQTNVPIIDFNNINQTTKNNQPNFSSLTGGVTFIPTPKQDTTKPKTFLEKVESFSLIPSFEKQSQSYKGLGLNYETQARQEFQKGNFVQGNPLNLAKGLGYAGLSFGEGIFTGVTGVISKPQSVPLFFYSLATKPKATVTGAITSFKTNPTGFLGEATGQGILLGGIFKPIKPIAQKVRETSPSFIRIEELESGVIKPKTVSPIIKAFKESSLYKEQSRISENKDLQKNIFEQPKVKFIEGTTIPTSFKELKSFEGKEVPQVHMTINPKFDLSKNPKILLEQITEGAKGKRKEIGALNVYTSSPEITKGGLTARGYLGYVGIGELGSEKNIVFSLFPPKVKAVIVPKGFITPIETDIFKGMTQKQLVEFQSKQSGKTFIAPENYPNLKNSVFRSTEGQFVTASANKEKGFAGTYLERLNVPNRFTYYKEKVNPPFKFLEGLYETKLFKGLGISEKRTKINIQYGKFSPVTEDILGNNKVKIIDISKESSAGVKSISLSENLINLNFGKFSLSMPSESYSNKNFNILEPISTSSYSKASSSSSLFSIPSYPSSPSKSSIPSYPSYPSIGSIPSYPSQPSKPSRPSIPSIPSIPSYPSEPSKPSKPSVPSIPSYPSYPRTPSKPLVLIPPFLEIRIKPKEEKVKPFNRKFTYAPDLLGIYSGKSLRKEPRGSKIFSGFEQRNPTEKELSISPFRDLHYNIFKQTKAPPFEISSPTKKQKTASGRGRKIFTNLGKNIINFNFGGI